MIDGVKFSVYGAAKDNLRQNPLLKFSEATYDGLRLRITPDACYVRGSLHRFKNRGEHNADDFTLSDFGNTLIRLSSELEINPEILVFSNVEFGLNVPLPFAIDEFLQSIILYRGEKTAGVVREPHGIRIEFTEYIVKAYDKTKVLPKHTEKDTLRFEIDITRTRRIRNQLMDDNTTVVRTLSDLAQPAVWRCFGNELVRAFDALVICDDSASASELQRINEIPCRMKKKRELDKFIQLSENSTMKKEVRKLICDKINDVTNSPKNASNSPFFVTNSPFFEDVEFEEHTENNVTISHVDKGGNCNMPLSTFSDKNEREKKEGVSASESLKNGKPKKKTFDIGLGKERAKIRCSITGLPLTREILNRSANDKYLTMVGVSWYHRYLPDEYEKVLQPFLPDVLRRAEPSIQYREIGRAIRSKYSELAAA